MLASLDAWNRIVTKWTPLLLLATAFGTLALPGPSVLAVVNPQLETQILETIQKHPEVILEALKSYEKRRRQEDEARSKQVAEAIMKAPAEYIGDSPVLGNKDAKSYLFVFSDFQCPYCSKAHPLLQEFSRKHPEVTLVYKHLPLATIHSEAIPAAAASWAAQQQGKFWPFHDILLAHQDRISASFYLQTAKQLGLNPVQFERDRNSKAALAAIQRDLDLAKRIGLSGTPSFVLNGEAFSGLMDVASFEKKLQ
jgi:protein-disulfide isomerase